MADDTHGGKDNSDNPNRTSRTIAKERNEAKNFDEGPAYDIKGGHPITKDMPSQEYKPMAVKQATDSKPVSDTSAPFTIKGS